MVISSDCTDESIVGGAATGRLPVGCAAAPSDSGLELVFRILGPLEAASPAGPIRLGGPRQRSVLALLLLDANRVVSIDRLADQLYGEAPADQRGDAGAPPDLGAACPCRAGTPVRAVR